LRKRVRRFASRRFARPERTILDDELEELCQQFREREILDDELEETPTGGVCYGPTEVPTNFYKTD